MSGPLPEHRTPSRPMVDEGGNPVIKVDKYGYPVIKHTLIPGPYSEDGRPTFYEVLDSFAERHVLDYSPALHRPSKHARGRIRPRTAREQRHARNLQARLVRASKKATIDLNRFRAYMEASEAVA